MFPKYFLIAFNNKNIFVGFSTVEIVLIIIFNQILVWLNRELDTKKQKVFITFRLGIFWPPKII